MSSTQQHPSHEKPGHRTSDTSRPYEIGSSKIPEVTLAFLVVKILATTFGETFGDAVSMFSESGLCHCQHYFHRYLNAQREISKIENKVILA
jgi:hypothetical protein